MTPLRLIKFNKHVQRILGEILQRDTDMPADVLVTITRVDTASNLFSSDIWLSILPSERAEEVIEVLTPQLYDIQGALNRALDQRPLPRIRLRVDYGAEHSAKINEAINNLDK